MSSSPATLYERDFVRWTESQAAELRRAAETGTNLPLDWLRLAEEVEILGREGPPGTLQPARARDRASAEATVRSGG